MGMVWVDLPMVPLAPKIPSKMKALWHNMMKDSGGIMSVNTRKNIRIATMSIDTMGVTMIAMRNYRGRKNTFWMIWSNNARD
jgi:hypothetical protein